MTDDAPARAHRLPLVLRAAMRVAPRRPAAVDRVARRVLRDGRLYVAAGGYRLAVDRDDPFQRAMLLGTYDPWLEEVAARYVRPGEIVFDCGAYLGFVTVRLARMVGPGGAVHAFEPDPRVVPRLRAHLDANGAAQVRLNQALLHDSDGELPLRLTDQLGWASVQEVWDAAAGTQPVPAVRLDSYVEREGIDPARIAFIKIDVEGSELAALRGAEATLAETNAPVLVEVIPWRLEFAGGSADELHELMAAHGYGAQALPGDDVLFMKVATQLLRTL